MIPGELLPADGEVRLNENRQTATVTVANTGDRPIQVGSHFHFFQTNRALKFDREGTFGMRLDIPAGTSARFEPGDEREVGLVNIGGRRVVHGFNGLTEGALDDPDSREEAFRRARELGFMEKQANDSKGG